MPPAIELFNFLARSRADTFLVLFGAVVACAFCRRFLQRRQAAGDVSRLTYLSVVAIAVAGAAASEWMSLAILRQPAFAGAVALAARLALLGIASLIGTVTLVAAARLALLRAELRAHAATAQQLQHAKLAADEASRAKSDFLAVMSHEIRTPLNAVMGFASLLSDSRLDEAQRGYLATITSEGSRLTSLINDILDLTKIEEGRLALERLPFSPVETAQEVLRLLSARAMEKHIDLRFEAQLAGPLLVTGDPLRFRQVLVNLVDNAIKFTSTGAVTLFLRWDAPSEPGRQGLLRVDVHDTGVGIPAEKLKDLFQMFMQADTSTTRRFGGTGLGLAICQRLVRLMGSDIAVQSTRGSGSQFSFTLPLTPVLASVDTPAPDPEPAILLGNAPRILVVDDMETNRFLLEVFLRRNGFEPDLASNGEEAIRRARENTYDAILMDLQMPDIDGFAATARIRAAEPSGHRTPIIALTATITKGTRGKCLAAGMDDYLTKPLDLRRFKSLLNSLLAPASTSA